MEWVNGSNRVGGAHHWKILTVAWLGLLPIRINSLGDGEHGGGGRRLTKSSPQLAKKCLKSGKSPPGKVESPATMVGWAKFNLSTVKWGMCLG